ncbi:MAG: Hpt domain-containing protein [Gammaproteobacteria bacterium]|jgi:chemosensory pili system protein ChpA (sensor histidine kinase/response regulator)
MKPQGTVEYNSLSWVKQQLDTVINDAQSSLSEYIEHSDDASLMQECIESLRLVNGTLQMVEIFGAAMLAEEMEQTAKAILEGHVDNRDDAYDVLMRAMLQLPDYLEGLQAGNKDNPMALLPLMNDLRAIRKESLLSENVLFFPDMDSVDIEEKEIRAPATESGRLYGEAKRLRTHYQLGLLDVLKNNKQRAGCQRMLAVIAALEKASADQSVRRFWSVIAALLEGLYEDGIDSNASVKTLLGSVDRQIKMLIDAGEEGFATQYSQELLKNILYYIGNSRATGKRVTRIKEIYNLDELLASATEGAETGMGGLNAELFATVSQGIKEDLSQVKDALEIFIHSSEKSIEDLAPLSEQLVRIADTFAMLGLGDARQKVLEQKDKVQSIAEGSTEANEEILFAIAGELLGAEADLNNYVAQRTGFADYNEDDEDRIVPAAEYRQVLSTVISQGLLNFSDAKEAILSFTSGVGNEEQLQSVLDLLEEVRGVSMILPMAQVEEMLARLKDYVKIALIENSHQPDAEEQDKVADVVTAIEYFFEAMAEGRPGVEAGLRTGEEALEHLVDVSSRYQSVAAPAQSVEPIEQTAAEDAEKKPITTEAESTLHEAEIVEFRQPEPAARPVTEPAASPTPRAEDEAVSAAEMSSEYGEFEILGDDADEEILEIFIEEALEVLEELHSNLPQWKANTGDEEALTVVRRCFHTLKGSGRLIGAQLIGEFSWKFENMLNRVIDKKIEPDTEVLNALDEAVAVLPQLIEQLQGNREPVPNVYNLMANADALAEGKTPPVVSEQAATAETAAEEPVFTETATEDTGSAETAVEEEGAAADVELAAEAITAEQDAGEAGSEQNEIEIEDIEQAPDESPDSLDINELSPEEEIYQEAVPGRSEDDLSDDQDITGTEADEEISLDLAENEFEADNEVPLASADVSAESINLDEVSLDITQTEAADEAAGNELAFEIDEPEETIEQATELAGGMDPVLFQIYYDESVGHLDLVQQLLEAHYNQEQPLTANKDLIRAFHTLYGSARTAEIDQIAELCGATEKYVKSRQEGHDLTIDEDVVQLIAEVAQKVRSMLDEIKAGATPTPDRALLEKVNKAVQVELQEQLQQSSRGSEAPAEHFPEDAAEIEEIEVDLDESAGDEMDLDEFDIAAPELEEVQIDETLEEDAVSFAEEPAAEEPAAEEPAAEEPAAEEPAEESKTVISYGEIDDDLIDIFIEEADELIESCEELLQKITSNPDDADSIHQLQRYMHTLKGGARMAELTPVGDLTHLLESLVIKVSDKQVHADKLLFDTLNDSVDRLAVMLKNVKDRAPIESATELVAQLEAMIKGEVHEKRAVERFDLELEDLSRTAGDDEAKRSAEQKDENGQQATAPAGPNLGRRVTDRQERPQWGERATDVNYRDTQEQIRVRADLLNELVNSAGEVNIYHARMGKQINDIGFNLNELESTVVRLKQQLRNLEIETEIQIRSSFEKESDQYDDDFDPLEMDKYSTIQQLSRSLGETASDVESIREILSEIVRDSETLLMQESRVSTELQEGLMRTRMVRFGGLSTRLRRIVRQTSRELGKEVELEVDGDTNELDRTILDRIIAPLEHMLRNAVAHGIEAPDKRLAAGKPETGRISIKVDRQGADVLLKVKDDGAGINAAAIRAKAIKQGLLDADTTVSDRDVLQFILKAGFSTAETVSQVAGRGVGMDVVDAELKQLGGVLEIDTTPGRGTEFTIRLPLTLAINQALLVSAGEDIYAIPLASIEGVVRVTGAELQRFYNSDQQMYEFNNVEYELKHLGQLLTGQRPDYSEQYGLFPVLLAQVGNSHFALHVDDLVGRREIVVKPVGHQIGMVRGIAGATILADGRVVLILEMSALVVGESLFKEPEHVEMVDQAEEAVPEKFEERTIMVVDDSITIRKVTARMLERNGIHVILAKDGIDATNQLIDTKPDLMLLDIEMPRMDGFELATYIRNDERLKDLPIIMITSRTGEKHKEKAIEIGVNQYLGKPYQEEELLRNINEILEA